MNKQLSREIKRDKSGTWQAAIAEAERQIAEYKRKVLQLRDSIKISRRKIAAGEPWPGEQVEDHSQGQQHSV
jgi:hypothetical protein